MARFSSVCSRFFLFLSFVLSIIAYSAPFYFSLYSLFVGFLVLCITSINPLITFFGTLCVALFLFHGWRGLAHVIEDYTFNPVLRLVFVFLTNLILLRFLIILFI